MVTVQIPPIYDELLDFLLQKATPDEILGFQASETAQTRASYLLDKNSAGTLTPAEEMELAQMLYFDRKMSVLKANAAAKLKKSL
jgi:hypothetical protein